MQKPEFRWNEDKNQWLKRERKVSFEAVVAASESGNLIVDIDHPTRENQRLFIVEINNYLCTVPYVTDGTVYFLKTIYPNRDLYDAYKVLK